MDFTGINLTLSDTAKLTVDNPYSCHAIIYHTLRWKFTYPQIISKPPSQWFRKCKK